MEKNKHEVLAKTTSLYQEPMVIKFNLEFVPLIGRLKPHKNYQNPPKCNKEKEWCDGGVYI